MNRKRPRTRRNARSPSSSSSSSASWASAAEAPAIDASSQSDELQSPPSPPRPARRRGRQPRPPAGLEPAGPSVPPTAPASGGVVRRMRWTQSINENVMRAYYGATEGGTNLTAYRSKMLSLFQVSEPSINVSAQRLSDQVRFIQRRKLLDDSVLDRLRADLRIVPTRSVPHTAAVASPSMPQIEDEVQESLDNIVSTQDIQRLRGALESAIFEFKSVSPLCRPRLPRLPTHKRNLALVRVVDSMLHPYMESSRDLVDTQSILYCSAVAVCRVANVSFPNDHRVARDIAVIPAWQRRIENRISRTRTLISKLICFRNGNTRPRVMRFVALAFSGTGISPQNYKLCATERIDFLKQKVYAWANRIRRYKKRSDRFRLNRTFQSDQKRVYRCWENSQQVVGDMGRPDEHNMRTYWENIWSSPVSHTEDASWIGVVERACEKIQAMEAISITPEDILGAIRPAQNWKSPGPDGLHNFWLKWLPSSHPRLATQYQEALVKGSLPTFMTRGCTHLLFKSGSTTDPKNYRPITCLPTTYKILTSIIRSKITDHINKNNIIYSVQTGCKIGSRGTKELLLIDMTICQQVRRSRRNLSAAWIDYKKAYDSVPHTWLRRVLNLYKIDTNLCTFLGACMRQWTTVLRYPSGEGPSDCNEPIRIERGIFQGDSLSPLWFCLALNPLSTLLLNSGLGYRLRRGSEPISHLLYMDDLKLFAPKKSDLIELLKITESFSNSINMEFGVDKCAVIQVERGEVVVSEDICLSETIRLKFLSETETYKYLGMSEALGIKGADVRQSLKERFFCRLTKVLNSLLSGGNKIRAVNGWVMPVLMYSFGILKWTQTELDALDRKIRTLLTRHRMHHPRSSVMRLYIPRRCGGRGLLNAKDLHNREICNLRDYFLQSDVGMHEDMVRVDKGLTPLSLANENWRAPVALSTGDREEVWKSKELHGRFYRALNGPDVNKIASVSWLRFGDLFGETEGFVFAIMDEVVKTNNYRKYILKDGTVDICRACHRPGESIRHVISGCSYLANGEYLHRHNLVAKIIHQQLALRYRLVISEVPYYQYVPQPVLENGHATLYWDRSIITDRTIIANKPDIVIVDRLARRAIVVDVTVPHDDNLVKAEKDKMSKYLDLAHEVTDMWDVDSTIIVPIVVTAHGLIPKSLDQHLKRLSIGRWVGNQIQKAVLLDTARIVRRFLTLGS